MGRLPAITAVLLIPDISCNKSYSIACPGSACSRFLSCSASCKALLMLIFFCSNSYFCNGSDLRRCAGKTCFSWVIPDRCRQDVTATEQGEVLCRCQFYNHFSNISAKVGLTLFLIVFFSLVFVCFAFFRRYQFKTISVFVNDVIAKRFSPIFRCQPCCH